MIGVKSGDVAGLSEVRARVYGPGWMGLSQRIVWFWPVCAFLSCAGAAVAQTFPAKPIRIVAAEAGSSNDMVARLLAPGLTAGLGQQTIVENRGGGGVVAPEIVAKAPADGHTLLLNGSNLWLAQYLRDHVPYAMTDFVAVSWAASSPGFLVVHPSLPINSVKDLIAYAKAKPGALNYASGSPGALTHLAPELFKHMTGTQIVRIPYKGGGPALSAVIAGEVQIMFATAGGVTPQIKAGRLRGLAVTSAQPSALLPELPTVAASGLPGYESVAMNGILAPAKTPTTIIKRLNQEIVRVLGGAEVKDKLLSSGVEAVGSTPAEFAAKIKSEMGRLGRVIKEAGIRAE
jgi:tripartite-type tricarboxylate transporter receptor subunit TctC